MAEMDEFTPGGWANVEINPGAYVFLTKIKKCEFKDTSKEKPYMQMVFLVTEGTHEGFEVDSRIYVTKAAEWRARYFLKKFDYPEELLQGESPVLKRNVIIGLEGKILVVFETDNFGMMKADIKKFDHINGDECEKELAKINNTQENLPLQPATDAEPGKVIDVNADVIDAEVLGPDGSAEDTVQQPEAHDPEEPEPDLSFLD